MAAVVHGLNKPTFNFSPLSIPSCSLWLDAKDSNNFVFSSGSNISQWLDRSGYSNHLVNVSGTPIHSTPFSGLARAVVLNGTNYLWATTYSNAPTSATGMTTIFVGEMNSTTPSSGYVVSFGSNTGNTVLSWSRNSTVAQFITQNAGTTLGGFNISYNTPYLVLGNFGTGSYQSVLNDTTFDNRTSTMGVINRFAVGTNAINPTTSTQRYNGGIYEIIVYNRSLTPHERTQISGYLFWKWRSVITGWVTPTPATTNSYYYPYMQHARPFDPIDATNLVSWLDGNDPSTITTDVNSRVTRWRDKRSPASAAAPYTEPASSTVYQGPIYNSNDGSLFFDNNSVSNKTAGQAGLRLMAFSNTSVARNVFLTQTTGGNPSPYVAGNMAYFIVYNNSRSATTTSNALIEFQNSGTPTFSVIGEIGMGAGPTYTGPIIFGGANTVTLSTSTAWSTSGSDSILSVIDTSGTVNVRMNGTSIATTTGSPITLAQPTIYTIGAHIDNRTFTGYIKEILVYDMMNVSGTPLSTRSLIPSDIERVEGYLAHKWRLTSILPDTHSFKRVPPTIARVSPMISTINSSSLHNYSSFGVYNKYGDFKWKVVGGISNGFTGNVTAVTTDSYENAIIATNTGNYQPRNQDDTIFTTFVGGNNAIALSSYHPSGYIRWNAKLNLSTNNTIVWSLGIDNSDNILMVGANAATGLPYTNAAGTTIFTRDYTGITAVSGFVAKYDINGTPLWAAKIYCLGGGFWCPTCTAVSDTSNNVFIVNENRATISISIFNGTGTNSDTSAATFTPTNTSLVLAKYDPNGTVLNFTRLGSNAWVGQNSSTLVGGYQFSGTPCGTGTDSNGNFFFAGNWSGASATLTAFNHPGTVSGGTLTNSGTSNGFIVKYTSALAVSALTKVGGTSADQIWNSCVDSNGNVYICGTFTSATLTFFNAGGASGGTLTRGVGTGDGFIAKYNNNLTFLWAARISGTSTTTTAVRSLTFDNRNGVLLAGLETQATTVSFFNANRTIVSRTWTKRTPGTSYGVAITWWDPDNGALLISREHSISAGNLIAPTQLATDSAGTVYLPQGNGNASNQSYYYYNQ